MKRKTDLGVEQVRHLFVPLLGGRLVSILIGPHCGVCIVIQLRKRYAQ